MTKVTFNADEYELKIEGHADYAEKGKDIVCSAVSILFYTLVASIDEAECMFDSVEKEIDDGCVRLKVQPKQGWLGNTSLLFWQTMIGYQLLADDYPDNVKLEIL